jgi:hypothetical protein
MNAIAAIPADDWYIYWRGDLQCKVICFIVTKHSNVIPMIAGKYGVEGAGDQFDEYELFYKPDGTA